MALIENRSLVRVRCRESELYHDTLRAGATITRVCLVNIFKKNGTDFGNSLSRPLLLRPVPVNGYSGRGSSPSLQVMYE